MGPAAMTLLRLLMTDLICKDCQTWLFIERSTLLSCGRIFWLDFHWPSTGVSESYIQKKTVCC